MQQMARGHLVKRAEGSWSIVVELERDPRTGKGRQKWVTFKGVKRDAEKEMAKLLVDAENGAVGNAGRLTTGEYLDKWLGEHAKPNLAPKTYAGYRLLVEHQLK